MQRAALVIVLGVSLLLGGKAWAEAQCYTSPELEAEQLLRLHSELMVVAITCRTDSFGANLVPAYTGFTQAHLKSLRAAEQVMKLYYRKVYGGDGTEQLDKLRTKLGNEYGQKIADLSAPVFCQIYRDQALQICHEDQGQIRLEVTRMIDTEKSYARQCLAPAVP